MKIKIKKKSFDTQISRLETLCTELQLWLRGQKKRSPRSPRWLFLLAL